MTRPDADTLAAIERTAVELAQLAGAEIQTALGGMLAVKYKTGLSDDALRDPVSEVDHRVEVLLRARLGERFPEHDIIGEEIDDRSGRADDFVWAVDPIDGTTNFVNGFPIFAATIGVLWRGEPIAGAIWCTTSHALRAGVYHAHAGGGLHFDNQPVARAGNPAVRRRIAGIGRIEAAGGPFETRKTGSAALECALVAAGPIAVARFETVNLWDVAAGVALVQAAGGAVRVKQDGVWTAFDRFAGAPDLHRWKSPMILGDPAAVETMVRHAEG